MWLFDDRKVPSIQGSLPGPKAAEMLKRDHRFVSPSYTRGYPLVANRGSGSVIEDVDGNLFLDCTAGIAVTAAGHCHPDVVAAIQDQSSKLLHMSGTDFYYGPQIDLAQRLAEAAPGEQPRRVFFTNSGAESLEAALKLSRRHTGRSRVIAFFGGFHGRTYGAMSLSGSKVIHRQGFSPLVPDIHHTEYPRAGSDGSAEIEHIEKVLFKRIAPADEVAAIIVEPIQGEGGYHVPPPNFLPELRRICDEHGILLVADEVQAGMGRTGKMFAVEHWNVAPDIICLAKGIASGMPLGAIIASEKVMDWPPGSHASTFGGNPVSCRAALATMDLLDSELIANAEARGRQFTTRLEQMRKSHSVIGEVRGKGLMLAMEVVSADGKLDPSARDAIVDRAFYHGLLLLGCGESAIRFCPSLSISEQQVDDVLSIVGTVLAEYQSESTEPAKRRDAS